MTAPNATNHVKTILITLGLIVASASAAAQWKYSNKTDQMSDGKIQFASVVSKNSIQLPFPYQGGTAMRATFRLKPNGSLNFYLDISRGQFLCHEPDCFVTIRFDDQEPKTVSASGPSDGSIDTIFLDDEQNLLEAAQAAKRIRIATTLYQAGTPVFDFNVRGLKWPAAPVRKASE